MTPEKKILFRGVGLGNWLLPEGYMWKFGDGGDRPRKIEHLVTELIGRRAPGSSGSNFERTISQRLTFNASAGWDTTRSGRRSMRGCFLSDTDPPVPLEEGFATLDNLVGWCKAQGIYVILDMHGAPGGQDRPKH